MKFDLLGWLEEPSGRYGPRYARNDGGWDRLTWEEMARRVHATADLIASVRRSERSPVAIVVPNTPEFLAAYFGTLLAGHTPCPLAPPNALTDPVAYCSHVEALLRVAQPGAVLCGEAVLPLVERACSASGAPAPQVLRGQEATTEHPRERPAELALLQFTSGSSGRPRAARVSWSNLQSNIEMMFDWVIADPEDDQLVTWLPHYHDMGLIGCLLSSTIAQGDLWVMRPEQFVRNPLRWLECFGRHGVTLTGAPSFGLAHTVKRVRPEQLEGMDFSGWRVAALGGERIDAGVASRFTELLEPFGFRASTLVGGYGLAEATLLVSGRYGDMPAPAVKVDWETLRFGEPLAIEDQTAIGDTPRIGDGVGWLVSCGWPHRGVSVTLIDDDGVEVPDGTLGEIVVGGRCVAQGYLGDDDVGTARFVDGTVHTGDAGAVIDGELYVLGRIGDSLKVRGRAVYVEDLEARLVRIDGVGLGRGSVFCGSTPTGDVVIALVEADPGPWVQEAEQMLAEALPGVRVEILRGRPGTIARTSSGKVRRRVMWRAYVEGTLGAVPADAAAVGAA
jgi:acyl-CoA synthetase (AMP-forming)/AMP-acid ligase II